MKKTMKKMMVCLTIGAILANGFTVKQHIISKQNIKLFLNYFLYFFKFILENTQIIPTNCIYKSEKKSVD
ncbi:MAG: hypothetical protein IJD40_13900, partial [Lachnospiraceae bacterium]|nr:hypothetical protein [Lachnospiraceae bacterium]